MPKPSLPVRLALLVAGTTLPLIVFAVVIVFNNYQQDRKEASQRVLETARSIRLVLDAEMQRMTGGLQVLALTRPLRNGDFEGFRRIASGFLDQYGREGVVLVADREGRLLFSSAAADSANLPLRNNREIVERVFATGTPQYSNLFIGAVKKRPLVTVEVPVLRDGEVLYDISFGPPLSVFQAIIEKQRPEQGLDDFDFRRRPRQFRARAKPGRDRRQARIAVALCRDASKAGSKPADDIARRHAADHDVRAVVADRLDGGRRDRGKLAGRAAVAQPRRHQPDRRRAAADRACLCRAHGHDDRPRRSAS